MWTDPSFSGLSPDLDIKIAARSRCHGGDFPHAIVEFRCPRADMRCRLLAPIVRQLLFRQADRLSLCNAWMTRRLNTERRKREQETNYGEQLHLTRKSSATAGETELCCGIEC